MSYQIVISRKALKDMASLPKPMVGKISRAIEELSGEPRPAGSKKLKGKVEYLWRIRIGSYRVIYNIQDTVRIVEVRDVGHRRSIYG